MKKKTIGVALLAALCANAFAQGASNEQGSAVQAEMSVGQSVSVFAGLRLWANKWDVPYVTREAFLADPTNPASLMLRDLATNRVTSYEISPMPFVAVRFGDVLASVSYLPETEYDMGNALSENVKRDELDINVGYYVHPRLVLSLGYKQGKQSKTTDLIADSEVKVKGLLVGASLNAPVSGPFSLYGNFAYGLSKAENQGFKNLNGDDELDGSYKVAEIGVSYNLSHLLGSGVLKGAALTFGYRSWVLSFDDFPVGTYAPSNPLVPVSISNQDTRSTTEGFVLGAVAVF
ncbi:MAG: hypothetical protein KDG55_09410 [Rhodocyclaceae bacterium]|nr:hypothetical protein [Rhodocyclaceae bacterium]